MARLNGKDSLLLVQATDNVLGADGYLIGDETEHSHSIERELTDEQTKFGRILGPGQVSESFDITFYASTDDPGQKAVYDSIRKGTQLKIWEVQKPLTNGKHNALFAYVYVESYEKSAPTDGFLEISATVQVLNTSKEGQINPLPDAVLNFGDYDFEAPGETTGDFGTEQEVKVTSVIIDPKTASVAVGATTQLTAAVVPVNATNKKVIYSVNTMDYANVDANGLVTGIAEGTATVTVKTEDGSFTDTAEITVTA